jgi:photosystem II stability/assembly factor-like uncharacterized protein
MKRKPKHLVDDPARRHKELEEDHLVVPGRTFAGIRQRGAKRPIAPAAELRLRALEHVAARAPVGVAPAAGGTNWVQLGPAAIPNGQSLGGAARVLVTGRITDMVVDSADTNTIYVAAAQGGVWKTTDRGLSWKPLSDNEVSLAIGAIAMDPDNHPTLYAGTGEANFSLDSYYGLGVLKTTDGGTTWTRQGQAQFTGRRFARIVVTPGAPKLIFAATDGGLFRSTDAGANWTALGGLPAGAATDVRFNQTTPTTVFVAIHGQGIFRTTNGGAAVPAWQKLAGGLPAGGFGRIALGISASSPSTIYTLMGDNTGNGGTSVQVNRFMRSTDGGNTWTNIPLPGGNLGGQGFYNLAVNVDPTTPDIVFLSVTSLFRATRTGGNNFTITDIGQPIHADNHALAFGANNLEVYAGNDGGIYRSTDGGNNFSDLLNKGMCIMQYEFLAQHPTASAVVFGGTQDNGTQQYRNSEVFHHADEGDGGFCQVDFNQPHNVLHTFFGASPFRSTQGGTFGTFGQDLRPGIGNAGNSLFYPPLAMDETNPNNVAIGTTQISIDNNQGRNGWPIKVNLPNIGTGLVSAIDFVNSNLLYVGTNNGRVYQLVRAGAGFNATDLTAAPLPLRYIWDISTLPGDPNTVVLCMETFQIQHVFRGAVAAGAAVWTAISNGLPDIPVNALVVDTATNYFIATDTGVFRTTDAGANWTAFSEGLPNCASFDLKLHQPSRILRVATHGRGLWERVLEAPVTPPVDTYVRKHMMDDAHIVPVPNGVPAAFANPLEAIALDDPQFWWMCPDIRVDSRVGTPGTFQTTLPADVDYVFFESRLAHRAIRRGTTNRVYLQIHNRGFRDAHNVVAKIFFANAATGLPKLPPDFWTAFPPSNSTGWAPVGPPQTVPLLQSTQPAIVEWDWNPPPALADPVCLLAVIESPDDPIPAANKVLDITALVPFEKRVGLKNMHVVASAGAQLHTVAVQVSGAGSPRKQTLEVLPFRGGNLSVEVAAEAAKIDATGFLAVRRKRKTKAGASFTLTASQNGGVLTGITVPKKGIKALFTLESRLRAPVKFTVIQRDGTKIIGGNTFIVQKSQEE